MRVLKFGGKSLSTPEKIKKIATKIASFKDPELLIVVSAMGNSTSQLLELASDFSSPSGSSQRELDMLLASGERVSAALFALALQQEGLQAESYTGSQAGILTQGPHKDASIKELKPIRIDEALNKGIVPIVAGFQGVDPESKNVTTLGRGGSDLTAAAFAKHYNCELELYKSVGALYTADPFELSEAQSIKEIDISFLKKMSQWGAKILHDKAADFIEKEGVNCAFYSDQSFERGSVICSSTKASLSKTLFAVSSLDSILAIKLKGLKIAEASDFLSSRFASLSYKILASAYNQEDSRFLIRCEEDQKSFFMDSKEIEILDSELCALSLIFSQNQERKIFDSILSELKEVEIKRLLETESRLSFFIDRQKKMELLKKLHSLALKLKL